MSPVGGHGHDGNAEVDPQHVDDAETQEREAGHDVATLQRLGRKAAAEKVQNSSEKQKMVDGPAWSIGVNGLKLLPS